MRNRTYKNPTNVKKPKEIFNKGIYRERNLRKGIINESILLDILILEAMSIKPFRDTLILHLQN